MQRLNICLKFFFLVIFINSLFFFLNSHKLYEFKEDTKSIDPGDYVYETDSVEFDREAIETFKKLLVHLHMGVKFFERNYKSVNVDGLYGIRIAQGAIAKLDQNLKADKSQVKSEFLSQVILRNNLVENLAIRLRNLANKIYNNVNQESPQYAGDFDLMINKPFVINDSTDENPKFINKHLKRPVVEASVENDLITSFNEPFSDKCYSLLMRDNQANSCATSDECFDFFTESKASEYYLTHQLLYFLIADHIGCSEPLIDKFLQYLRENGDKEISQVLLYTLTAKNNNRNYQKRTQSYKERVLNYYCSKIYKESKLLYEQSPNTPIKHFSRDLFIEQCMQKVDLKNRIYCMSKFLSYS